MRQTVFAADSKKLQVHTDFFTNFAFGATKPSTLSSFVDILFFFPMFLTVVRWICLLAE